MRPNHVLHDQLPPEFMTDQELETAINNMLREAETTVNPALA